jgi:SpoU rRNA methylase family enzyme
MKKGDKLMQNETTDRALQAQKNGAEIMKIAHKYGITVFDVLDISDALKSLPPVYDSEKDALATARAEGAQEERERIRKHLNTKVILLGDIRGANNGTHVFLFNDVEEALTTKEHHASK